MFYADTIDVAVSTSVSSYGMSIYLGTVVIPEIKDFWYIRLISNVSFTFNSISTWPTTTTVGLSTEYAIIGATSLTITAGSTPVSNPKINSIYTIQGSADSNRIINDVVIDTQINHAKSSLRIMLTSPRQSTSNICTISASGTATIECFSLLG